MKPQTIWILIILALAVIGGSWYLKNSKITAKKVEPKNYIVLYTQEGCPHCANIEKFVEENDIKNKISFETKDVNYSIENGKELVSVAQKCNLNTSDGIGVPLLWDGQKCYEGDTNVIDFFKSKTGIK